MKKAAIIAICTAAIAAGGIFGVVVSGGLLERSSSSYHYESSQDTETSAPRQYIANTIQWEGGTYTYNTGLKNVLVLGVDQREAFQASYKPGEAGQCDFLVLLSIDQESNTGKILEIHRNTLTEIDHFDEDGRTTFSAEEQLCLQYGYCIGGNASCRAAVKTVEELLYGITIDDYFTIDAAGIPELVDAFGGVDVTISADYTDLDPSFIEGKTVHMDGSQARIYIQSRDMNEFDSASDRMKRQTDFICGLASTLGSKGTGDLYGIYEAYNEKYLITDMSAQAMKDLSSITYDTADILTLPGETRMGDDGYEEYHVDQEALQKLVIENFYLPADQ